MLQVNIRAQQSTDEQRLQRMMNDALQAAEILGSRGWPWLKQQLTERRDTLQKQLLALNQTDAGDRLEAASLAGRIQELDRTMGDVLENRVAAYRRWQHHIETKQHTHQQER